MSNATCEHSSDALLNESCKESRATFSFKYVTWCIKERDVTFRSDAVRNASCTGERVISRNQSRHTQQSVIPPVPTTHHVMRHIRSDVTCLWHGTEWDVSGTRRVRRHDTFLSHVKEWVISGVTCHTRGKKKSRATLNNESWHKLLYRLVAHRSHTSVWRLYFSFFWVLCHFTGVLDLCEVDIWGGYDE